MAGASSSMLFQALLPIMVICMHLVAYALAECLWPGEPTMKGAITDAATSSMMEWMLPGACYYLVYLGAYCFTVSTRCCQKHLGYISQAAAGICMAALAILCKVGVSLLVCAVLLFLAVCTIFWDLVKSDFIPREPAAATSITKQSCANVDGCAGNAESAPTKMPHKFNTKVAQPELIDSVKSEDVVEPETPPIRCSDTQLDSNIPAELTLLDAFSLANSGSACSSHSSNTADNSSLAGTASNTEPSSSSSSSSNGSCSGSSTTPSSNAAASSSSSFVAADSMLCSSAAVFQTSAVSIPCQSYHSQQTCCVVKVRDPKDNVLCRRRYLSEEDDMIEQWYIANRAAKQAHMLVYGPWTQEAKYSATGGEGFSMWTANRRGITPLVVLPRKQQIGFVVASAQEQRQY